QQSWYTQIKEIINSIAIIKDETYKYKTFNNTLKNEQLKEAENKLFNARNTMGRVFCEGTALDKNVLVAYRAMLPDKSMSPFEIKIAVTHWFRQMLDYQVQAFSLYAALSMINDPQNNQIQSQVLKFKSSLMDQIKANKDHIDETIIYESQSYIA